VYRLLLLLALAAALLAPSASASPYVLYGIQDDAWLEYGPGSLDQRIAQLDALGTDVVRVTLDWRQTEPARGQYDWSRADALLDGLHAAGIAPLVTLYGSPAWANGGRGENWAPTSSSTFAAFARAAASRYPFVRLWAIWNEPNQVRSLRPTTPAVYVQRLLNPAYTAIHAVTPRAQVAGGVTAPDAAANGVSPVAWLQGMHAAHAKLDAYAHNPYPLSPRETPAGGGCGHCTTITMATLNRLESLVAKDFPRARIWLTEYGYQTNPPDRTLGVSNAKQAAFVGQAGLRAFQLPRVDILIHYLLQDEPEVSRFQSGLQSVTGKAKPSYLAFRFPLAIESRAGTRTVVWGQVRPDNGKQSYRLQQFRAGAWYWVGGTVKTSARGYLKRTVRASKGSRLRIWVPSQHAYSAIVTVS
jgi:glycosyl hydrolase family 42 (putative beta-galactosidase)